jgi:hypothetical protein
VTELRTLLRYLALGAAGGFALWLFGASLLLAAGVAACLLAFGSSLALGTVVADEVRVLRRKSTAVAVWPLAFWIITVAAVLVAIATLSVGLDAADATRVQAGAFALAVLGIIFGVFQARQSSESAI